MWCFKTWIATILPATMYCNCATWQRCGNFHSIAFSPRGHFLPPHCLCSFFFFACLFVMGHFPYRGKLMGKQCGIGTNRVEAKAGRCNCRLKQVDVMAHEAIVSAFGEAQNSPLFLMLYWSKALDLVLRLRNGNGFDFHVSKRVESAQCPVTLTAGSQTARKTYTSPWLGGSDGCRKQ